MEFNFSSRSGINLPLLFSFGCSSTLPSPSTLVCHLPILPPPSAVSATSLSLSLKDFRAANQTFQLFLFIQSRSLVCFWQSSDHSSHLSLVLCLIRLGHLPSASLNLFTAQNMACHSCSRLSHRKPMEFNLSSRNGINLPLLLCLLIAHPHCQVP